MLVLNVPVEIEGFLDKRKLKSRIIGWRVGEFVIIEHPTLNGEPAYFPKDAAIVCRWSIQGQVYGFKAHVLHNLTKPFTYLFLEYPFQFDEVQSEDQNMVSLSVPVSIVPGERDSEEPPPGGEPIEGQLKTLGVSNCRVACASDFKEDSVLFINLVLPDGTKVDSLKVHVHQDLKWIEKGVYNLEFDESDPKSTPIFNFVLLAKKIISQGTPD